MTRPTGEQIKALRKGDVVTVRAVVKEDRLDSDGDLYLCYPSRMAATFFAPPSEIMTIEPREIKVGDRVKHTAIHDDDGTVRCIERGMAAVLFDSGLFKVYPLSVLKVIP